MMVLKAGTAFASADHWADQGCGTRAPFVCQDLKPLPFYEVVGTRSTWSEALAYCEARSGSLAKIANPAEQEYSSFLPRDTLPGTKENARERSKVSSA